MYYPIDEEAARRAKAANSFYDYIPGSATEEYKSMVDKAAEIAERQKGRVDAMYHEKIDRLLDTYARKLAANMNESSVIEARVPSVMIAGPANFPVRKKEQQNNARDRNMDEWRYFQGLLDKIRSTGMGGISADDPAVIDKLKGKLARLEADQDWMKKLNAYYRKNKTLQGCPDLADDTRIKIEADMNSSWHTSPVPFASFELTNNSAEIRRVRKRIEGLERKAAAPAPEGWAFDGGRVELNRELNRVQIFFDEKPDEDRRVELKSSGFRWAPSQKAWQRQLTDNSIRAARGLPFLKPEENG